MGAIDMQQAHHNMVEQQVRPWEVLDDRVLQVLEQVARDEYVPEIYKALAYADTAIPLAHGEVMMHPVVEGRMLQALAIQAMDNVLEIGTGTGYITACLAHLASHVDSVDIHEDFVCDAMARLNAQGLYNVSLETRDAAAGPEAGRRWDVIAVTGSLPVLPQAYKDALTIGGRMFVITGQDPVMEARLITRTGEHAWADQMLFETSLKPLCHAEAKPCFVF